MKNNKYRILKLLEIFRKYSDYDTHISLRQINDLLIKDNIEECDRKTLYDDIKTLNQIGIDIEHDRQGYYLAEAPFSLTEIKIICDSLNSLKNLDERFRTSLKEKLYSFLSFEEEKILNDLEYTYHHQDDKLLAHMELLIEAIRNRKAVSVSTRRNKKDIIYPLFLHRNNDYYYLYYHYEKNDRLYHFRFDTIKDIIPTGLNDPFEIKKEEIIRQIQESTESYHDKKAQNITLLITGDPERIEKMLKEDFPDGYLAKNNKYLIKASLSNVLFSKLTKYGNMIQIKDEEIAQEYSKFLIDILSLYQPPKK